MLLPTMAVRDANPHEFLWLIIGEAEFCFRITMRTLL